MSDREDDAATGQLVDGRHDTVDFRGGGDHPNPDGLIVCFATHEPVLGDSEVVRTVDFLKGFDLLLRGEEKLGLVGATLCELDEGALGVPA